MNQRPDQWLRVLLVDDDEEEFLLMQDLLADHSYLSEKDQQTGFKLDWVDNAEQALPKMAAGAFDAYLVDFMLGEADGLALIRQALASGCTAPLILITGQGSYRLDVEAMKAGVTDYLPKGQLSAPLLERTLRYAVERKRNELALRRAQDELELRVFERTRELGETNHELAKANAYLAQANAALARTNTELETEVSERKRAEAALSVERQRLFNLLDLLPAPAFLQGPDHVIRFANHQFKQRFGSPDQNPICYQLIHHRTERCLNCPLCDKFGANGPTAEWEMDLPDGSSLQMYAYPFQEADGTQLVMELGIDITQRKRAEAQLAENNRNLLLLSHAERHQRQFAEGLAQAAMALNNSLDLDDVLDRLLEHIHHVIPCDAVVVSLLNESVFYTPRHRGLENRPESWDLLQKEMQLAEIPYPFREMYANHRPYLLEDAQAAQLAAHVPGSEWVGSYVGTPLLINDRPLGFINLLSAQTNFFNLETVQRLLAFTAQAGIAIQNAQLYKALENALSQEQKIREELVKAEKLGALGRMIGSVAHELNNPLQTIKNCLFLAQEDLTADQVAQEYLQIAASETQRLSNLVTQLRDIYRPRTSLPPLSVDLGQVVREVHTLLEPRLKEQMVTWRQPVTDSCQVLGQGEQLKQVFLNLGINALEALKEPSYAQNGQIQVKVERWTEQGQACVTVHDNGPGIPPENITKLFEPFFTTKPSGLGLGLVICYEIIERHNGRIEVESRPGEGTVFRIWLPVQA